VTDIMMLRRIVQMLITKTKSAAILTDRYQRDSTRDVDIDHKYGFWETKETVLSLLSCDGK
jgi:hypothetical protein